MSNQSTSTARIDQVTNTINTLLSNFQSPVGPNLTREQFLSILHPEIRWRDHAFLVCRIGHEAVLGLHKSWLHCNQPFEAKIKAIHPTPEGAVLEQVWHGRQANDIVRPDGTVAVKASKKDFVCHVCMIFKIDSDGLIVSIDEYYNKRWDDGVAEEEYTVMKGSSLKTVS